VRSHIGSLNGAPRVAEALEVGERYHVPVTANPQGGGGHRGAGCGGCGAGRQLGELQGSPGGQGGLKFTNQGGPRGA